MDIFDTYLANISFSSCSDTNWPKFATNNVEHGALADIGWLGGWVVPVEPTGLANAGLAKKWPVERPADAPDKCIVDGWWGWIDKFCCCCCCCWKKVFCFYWFLFFIHSVFVFFLFIFLEQVLSSVNEALSPVSLVSFAYYNCFFFISFSLPLFLSLSRHRNENFHNNEKNGFIAWYRATKQNKKNERRVVFMHEKRRSFTSTSE